MNSFRVFIFFILSIMCSMVNSMEFDINKVDKKAVGYVKSKVGDDYIYRDISSSYRLITEGYLIWFFDSEYKNMSFIMYVNKENNEYVFFDSGERNKAIFTVLQGNIKSISGEDKDDFLNLIKALSIDPISRIGSSRFLSVADRRVGNNWLMLGWVAGDLSKEKKFREYCREPVFILDPVKNIWSVDFYVINYRGGVNRVLASGNTAPFSIKSLDVNMIENDGYFGFPEEM